MEASADSGRASEGLTTEYVRETAFYREALAMGLDQDDTIVRRRLAQKLEFLVQDLIDVKPPGDAELETYFDEHRASYRSPDLITFSHVFVDPDKWGNETERRCSERFSRVCVEAGRPDEWREGARRPVHAAALLPGANRSRHLEALRWWLRAERQRAERRRLAGSRSFPDTGYTSSTSTIRRGFPEPAFADVRDRVADDWMAAEARGAQRRNTATACSRSTPS